MNDRPLELKSPDNAMALGLYLTIGLLAIAVLVNPVGSPVLAAFFQTRVLASLWALAMMISAGVGLTAALLAARLTRPLKALAAEAGGAAGVCVTIAVYVVALITFPGPTPWLGILVFTGMCASGGWRLCQVAKELHLIRVAQRRKVLTTTESLADPRPEK